MNPKRIHLITITVLLSSAIVACHYGPPEIEIFPRSQTVVRGEIAVFVCKVTGSPNLQIEWTWNNGKKIRNNASVPISQRYNDEYIPRVETIGTNHGSVLRIQTLKKESFECVVSNGTEELVRAKADLNKVYEKPPGFPHIALRSSELQLVGKGRRTIIPCLATGDPKPTIWWLKNKIPLNMAISRYSLFEEQFLQISETKEEDEGNYECIAENSVGSELSSKLRLGVVDSPTVPTNLKVSDVNATCVHLSWSYGSDLEHLRYFTVRYKIDSADNFDEYTEFLKPIKLFLTLCDLEPDKEYEFHVLVTNVVGQRSRSSSVFATTSRQ